ncbi:hypothetical protein [Streptomyces sp. NBC_00316]
MEFRRMFGRPDYFLRVAVADHAPTKPSSPASSPAFPAYCASNPT